MANRSYGQYCGLAHALDLVGERWSLLIVRELATGPKRFKDLRSGLSGIGPNLLITRLRKLEGAGVTAREKLPPPFSASVYALTPRGRDLLPALVNLTRWGLETLPPAAGPAAFQTSCALMALRAAFRAEYAAGVTDELEFRVGREVFHVRFHDGRMTARLGAAPRPDCVLKADPDTFLAVLAGVVGLQEAARSGRITIAGDVGAWYRAASLLDFSAVHRRSKPELPTLDLTGRPAPRPRRLR